MMDNENIKWLTKVPATDSNFISHLHMATGEEINEALLIVNRDSRKGNASRMAEMLRERQRRKRAKEGRME